MRISGEWGRVACCGAGKEAMMNFSTQCSEVCVSSLVVSTCIGRQDLGVKCQGGAPEVECGLEISLVLPILGKFKGT